MKTIHLGGLVPRDWQARVITSDAQRIIVQGNRQTGKTTAAAGSAVYTALNQPSARVMTVSPDRRAGDGLREKIIQILTKEGVGFTATSKEKPIWLENGSEIITAVIYDLKGAGRPKNDLTVFDEGAFIDDATFEKFTHGRLLVLGTPVEARAAGFFQRIWDSGISTWHHETATGGFFDTAAAA